MASQIVRENNSVFGDQPQFSRSRDQNRSEWLVSLFSRRACQLKSLAEISLILFIRPARHLNIPFARLATTTVFRRDQPIPPGQVPSHQVSRMMNAFRSVEAITADLSVRSVRVRPLPRQPRWLEGAIGNTSKLACHCIVAVSLDLLRHRSCRKMASQIWETSADCICR